MLPKPKSRRIWRCPRDDCGALITYDDHVFAVAGPVIGCAGRTRRSRGQLIWFPHPLTRVEMALELTLTPAILPE